MESLGVMGWGLVAAENSSAVAAAVAVTGGEGDPRIYNYIVESWM